MAFQLKDIVPWGRSFKEYVAMFALSEQHLGKRILSCGDGPASFNSELSKQGGKVVSIDPLYKFSANDISQRIDETFDKIIRETSKNMDEFVWKHIRSIDELGEVRKTAMQEFLTDFVQGKIDGRYLPESAPILTLADDTFDLGISSHFLFLYSDHLDLGFHIDCITELCRVCGETRIFPLLKLGSTPSPHVQPVIEHFISAGYEVAQIKVPYEFQRGGNQMLTIKKVEQNVSVDFQRQASALLQPPFENN